MVRSLSFLLVVVTFFAGDFVVSELIESESNFNHLSKNNDEQQVFRGKSSIDSQQQDIDEPKNEELDDVTINEPFLDGRERNLKENLFSFKDFKAVVGEAVNDLTDIIAKVDAIPDVPEKLSRMLNDAKKKLVLVQKGRQVSSNGGYNPILFLYTFAIIGALEITKIEFMLYDPITSLLFEDYNIEDAFALIDSMIADLIAKLNTGLRQLNYVSGW